MLPPKPADIPVLYKRALAAQTAGRADDAMGIYRAILKTRPDLAEVHFQIGRIHAAAGRKGQAEAALRKALAQKPREAAIWQELGGVLSGGKLKKLTRDAAALGITISADPDVKPIFEMIRKGKLEAAETEALALTHLAPDAVGPFLALATARERLGKWDEVAEPARKAADRDPSSAIAKSLLGQALGRAGKAHLAEPALQEAVDLDPVHAPHLALLFEHSARFEAAERVIRKALAKYPERSALWVSLSKYLAILHQPDEARAALDKAIELGAEASTSLLAFSHHLEAAGFVREAEAVIHEAIGADPQNIDPGLALAALKQATGNIDGSLASLADLMRRFPDSWKPYKPYVDNKKITVLDGALAGMERHLADPSLSEAGQRSLNFAMGKAMADLGRHDRVFPYLDQANNLTARIVRYDFEKQLDQNRRLAAAWKDADAWATGSGVDDKVIFVTGTPRSGTTLVESILAAHRDIVSGDELGYLLDASSTLLRELCEEQRPREATLRSIAETYLAAARRQVRTDGVFTDKSIGVQFTIGFAALALPNARFLVLRRDPRDVGFSIYKNMFPEGSHGYATSLYEIGRYLRLSQAMVEFWAAELPEKVHVVDYAALTDEPEPNIRALIAAAGLDWDDACLEPHKVKRQVKTLSFAQVRQPIYKTSVAGWKRYEKELQPLFEGLQTEITLD